MDPIAHTLTGVALANAGVKQKVGRGSILALILASNMVDVDIFGAFIFPEPTWLYRRMWTHSLLTAPLLVLLAGFIFSRLYRNASWKTWSLVFGLGVIFHVFMDLINSYGVVLFFPLTIRRFELAWVFIIDLYVWGILLLALLIPFLARRLKKQLSFGTSARVALVGLLSYLSLCGILRERSLSILHQHAALSGSSYNFSYVFPEPFGPWNFRGVLATGEEFETYLIKPLSGGLKFAEVHKTDALKPELQDLVHSELGETYHWFFKAPVWKQISDEAATVTDLRFHSLLLERENSFSYLVKEGAPVGTRLKDDPAPSPKLTGGH